jgi:hypothetical protein
MCKYYQGARHARTMKVKEDFIYKNTVVEIKLLLCFMKTQATCKQDYKQNIHKIYIHFYNSTIFILFFYNFKNQIIEQFHR